MGKMTDPTNTLVALQEAINMRAFQMERGRIHNDIAVYLDAPTQGTQRITYAKVTNMGEVKAIAVFVNTEPHDGLPCFQIGYAVAARFYRQGFGTEIVRKSIAEMVNGFRDVMPSFFVEAIVGLDNSASLKIAGKQISRTPIEVSDEVSGQPAMQFLRRIG